MSQTASPKMDRIALIRSLGFLCLMLTVILLAPLVLLAFWPDFSSPGDSTPLCFGSTRVP